MASEAHEPLEVRSYEDGWLICVLCSCDPSVLPTTSRWLEAHHQGDRDSGVALLRSVVARQRAEAQR